MKLLNEKRRKLSVIIPIYNAALWLRDCLNSIENQDLDDFEVICVNDGSTDESAQIIDEYVKRMPQLRLLSFENNRGQAAARNNGMREANGEFIYFMDADDLLISDKVLSRLVQEAENAGVDVVLFEAEVFADDGVTVSKIPKYISYELEPGVYKGEKMADVLTHMSNVTVWSQLWRSAFLQEQGLCFDETCSPHEDRLFTFEALQCVDSVLAISERLYKYRYRQNAESRSFQAKRLHAYWQCYIAGKDFMQIHWRPSLNIWGNLFFQHIRRSVGDILIEMIKRGDYIQWIDSIEQTELEGMLLGRYPYLSKIMTREEYELLRQKNIIVYGAGKVSISTRRMLQDFGFNQYAIAISRGGGTEGIENIDTFSKQADNSVIILSVSVRHQREMREYAESLGFSTLLTWC